MKLFFVYISLLLILGCQKDNSTMLNPNHDHFIFNYNSFLKQSNDEIAQQLAAILQVEINMTSVEVTPLDLGVGLSDYPWVVKGFKYTAHNDASIVTWVDENNETIFTTYLLSRHSGSYSPHAFEIQFIDSVFKEILPQIGIELDGTEMYSNYKARVRDWSDPDNYFHYYRITLYQTFSNMKINTPHIECEIDGTTAQVNYLKFGKWYSNVNYHENFMEDEELLENAKKIFQSHEEVVSIPDQLTLYGLHFIDDHLCQRIGSAIIDEYGSFQEVYLDIFNADLFCIDNIYVD